MTEQLSGMDAAFLALETPESPMHVVGVLILDPAAGDGFSLDGLRQVIADRVHLIPPFCRRLVEVPLALDKPYWQIDPDVDIAEHVFDAVVPPPGDLRALGHLAGEIAEPVLDRSKPLWELHIATGLSDGCVALIAKVHHSTMYGAAGAEFIAQLLDLTPEISQPAPRDPDLADPAAAPGRTTLLRRALVRNLATPVAAGRLLGRGARGGLAAARSLAGAVTQFGRQAFPPTPARTAISGPPTPAREVAFTAVPIDAVRRAKDAAGVTLNDAVLALVALAVGGYLRERDALPGRSIVAGVPVNAGEGSVTGTNALATMMVALPVDVTDPVQMVHRVHENTVAAKAFTAAVGPGSIAELAELTTPALLSSVTWLTRSLGLAAAQPTLFNVVVSNVMGPPIPLYLAGAGVAAIVPLGPLLGGAGMNITVLSNMDRLDVGIMACPDLVEDVWAIAEDLPARLHEVLTALGADSSGAGGVGPLAGGGTALNG